MLCTVCIGCACMVGVKEWFLELCGTAWNDACGWLWEGWRGLQKRHWANCGPFSTPRVYSTVPGLMCTRKISSVPPTQPTTLVGYCQNAPSWRGRWGQPQPPTRLPDQTGVKLLVSYRRTLAHLKHCPCHFNPVEIRGGMDSGILWETPCSQIINETLGERLAFFTFLACKFECLWHVGVEAAILP